jgi:hypothetical protein
MNKKIIGAWLLAFFLVVGGASGSTAATSRASSAPPVGGATLLGPADIPPMIVLAEDRYHPVHIPAPALPEASAAGVNALTFRVNYNPPSCQGSLAPWSAEARAAFDYAASIWSSLLEGSVPVTVEACWRTDMRSDVLGSASQKGFYAWWDSGPALLDTWHTIALANQVEGRDLNGAEAEIYAQFSSTFNWYFGTDGRPGDRYDFVTVVLHEIGHGLGFLGSMRRDDGAGQAECSGVAGTGCWGLLNAATQTTYPTYYDRLVESGGGQRLVADFANGSANLGAQLVGNDLWLDGTNARAVQGGLRPKLYAPSSFSPGSSIGHLDDSTFNGTSHALMTHATARGEAIHHPGEIALGLFRDMNWLPVYVNGAASGVEFGSATNPYNTVKEGANAAAVGGTLLIRSGQYRETAYIGRVMTLKSTGGLVTIGQ